MNTAGDGSVSLGQDSTVIAPSSAYGNNDGWTAISPYGQSPYDGSPMNEYSGFGNFVPHGMPPESMPRMPPPLSQHQHQHQHQHHQHQHPHQQSMMQHSAPMGHHQLPMLTTAWPSQLTNPSPTSGTFSASGLSASPVPRVPPPVVEISKLPIQAEKGRKTLTTEQKRRMCQFYQDHPGTRQADIGREFGVERSTVSKVLRNKDQYLRKEQDPDPATLKRSAKSKTPDFDRALGNYIRRRQRSGHEIRDEEIMEQARLFAAHAAGSKDALGHLTGSWLQKFKQRHGVGTDRHPRRPSETSVSDSARVAESQGTEAITSPNEISPASPSHPLSPLSGCRSDEEARRERSMEYGFAYRSDNPHSATPLPSDVRDRSASSFSSGALSPTGTFSFSPDPNVGAFQPLAIRHDLPPDYDQRLRRNSHFPSIDIDFANQRAGVTTEPMTPQLTSNMSASSSAVDSPANEMQPGPYATNTGLTSPLAVHRDGSASGLAARTSSASDDTSPASPTHEDARRAATTLLNYLHNNGGGQIFQSSDYNAVVQLTKKLEIQPHQNHRSAGGGLSRIPEGDSETTLSPSPAMMHA